MAAWARETFTMALLQMQRHVVVAHLCRILFGAKGAVSLPAWGSAPGIMESPKMGALKAQFTPASVNYIIER